MEFHFKKIFAFVGIIFGIELCSLFSFNNEILTSLFFVVICIATFYIAWKNLGNGLLIALGELFIGSQGYLFAIERHGLHIPIRMGIFSVLLLVWLIKYFKLSYWKEQIKNSRVVQLFIIFFIVWVGGVVVGFVHHNIISNIISDSNAYLYWLLFPLFWELRTGDVAGCPPLGKRGLGGSLPAAPIDVGAREAPPAPVTEHLPLLRGGKTTTTASLFAASIITTTLKTALAWLLFSKQLFSHNFQEFIYRWIRDTRVGEIVTYDRGGYVRVFFQSHIFELLGLFIFLSILLYAITQKKNVLFTIYCLLITPLSFATVLMSYSRSFWLAGLVTFTLFLLSLLFQVLFRKFNFLNITWKQFALFIAHCSLIIIAGFTISSLAGATSLGSRATSTKEAALSSRWKLLPPLTKKVLEHPLIGSGFGTTVTYQSDDPRIKNEKNPEGWYTTIAFEWGYLDTVSEIGAIGLAVYLIFILAIAKLQWAIFKKENLEYKFLSIGLLTGLVALLVTHMFTPYLNHPLGIGFILLTILCV